QRTLLGPISPAEIDTGACGKVQVDLACNGEQGRTHSDGTRGLDKSTIGLSEICDKRLTWAPRRRDPLDRAAPCVMENAHRSDKSPSPSLRSARVLTGLDSAFSNPVPERLGHGMANMRLISRDA